MSHRYQAPEHTSEVFTAAGPRRADKNGVISLADDAPEHEHAALRAAGCELIAPAAAAPSKGSSKGAGGKGKAGKPAEPPAEPPAS